MADSNITGCIYGDRQGSIPAMQSFPIAANTSTTATIFMRVKASAFAPVVVMAQIVVLTADGGSAPTLSVGYTATGYTDLINAASTATAATGGTFLPASNAVGKKILIADTDLYYKQGGTPDGAGVTYILLSIFSVNTDTQTYLG